MRLKYSVLIIFSILLFIGCTTLTEHVSLSQDILPTRAFCDIIYDSSSYADVSGLNKACDLTVMTTIDENYIKVRERPDLKSALGSPIDVVVLYFDLPDFLTQDNIIKATVYVNNIWCSQVVKVQYSNKSAYNQRDKFTNRGGSFACPGMDPLKIESIQFSPDFINNTAFVIFRSARGRGFIEFDQTYLSLEVGQSGLTETQVSELESYFKQHSLENG